MPGKSERSCEVVAFARGQRSPGLSMAPKLYRQRQECAIYRAKPESSGECRLKSCEEASNSLGPFQGRGKR